MAIPTLPGCLLSDFWISFLYTYYVSANYTNTYWIPTQVLSRYLNKSRQGYVKSSLYLLIDLKPESMLINDLYLVFYLYHCKLILPVPGIARAPYFSHE